MTMTAAAHLVTQLGYLELNVSNLETWRTLATDILGAEERQDSAVPGRVKLRLDEHHHRITLQSAQADSIAAIGWEAPSRAAFDAARAALQARGIEVQAGSAAEIEDRRVEALIRFRDADGFPMEIYFGPWFDHHPLRPARPMAGFNCGKLGVGHVVLVSRDIRAAARFYEDVLGFRISDFIAWGDADAVFLRCNARHHSLALINESFGKKSGELHHLMLEANSLDDLGRAYDLVQNHKVPLVMTLGRHSNDQMISFYLKSPSGFALEHGWGGLLVEEDNWQVKHYSTTKLWGHQRLV
jgi:2,3-dihydroxybiphenyl 1,2-dioxygenase